MDKKYIDEILEINWYLVKKQLSSPDCEITELTRKYLTTKINRLIKIRQSVKKNQLTTVLF